VSIDIAPCTYCADIQRRDPRRHFDECPKAIDEQEVFYARAFAIAAQIEADAAQHKHPMLHSDAVRSATAKAALGTREGDVEAAAWHIVAIRLLAPKP